MDRIISETNLENITVAYSETGEAIKGIRLCKWAFNLLLTAEENKDKLSRRNMQIKDLKKEVEHYKSLSINADRLYKHAGYLLQEVKTWFTPVGKREPNFPVAITYPFVGLQTIVDEVINL